MSTSAVFSSFSISLGSLCFSDGVTGTNFSFGTSGFTDCGTKSILSVGMSTSVVLNSFSTCLGSLGFSDGISARNFSLGVSGFTSDSDSGTKSILSVGTFTSFVFNSLSASLGSLGFSDGISVTNFSFGTSTSTVLSSLGVSLGSCRTSSLGVLGVSSEIVSIFSTGMSTSTVLSSGFRSDCTLASKAARSCATQPSTQPSATAWSRGTASVLPWLMNMPVSLSISWH